MPFSSICEDTNHGNYHLEKPVIYTHEFCLQCMIEGIIHCLVLFTNPKKIPNVYDIAIASWSWYEVSNLSNYFACVRIDLHLYGLPSAMHALHWFCVVEVPPFSQLIIH